MGVFRDYAKGAIGDALLPLFRQAFEDVVYETLDARRVPTRTDFQELRDTVDRLRGEVGAATTAARRASEAVAALERRIAAVEARLEESAAPAPADEPDAGKADDGGAREARPTCKVPGCDAPVRARGFCARHYQKWRRGRLPGFPGPT